jgi:hypothetical protein
MRRYRTLLCALLGLVFLLQGMAVSAAPTMTADTPCQDYSCCDAACPNMSTCALGHIAAPPVLPLALPAAARTEHAFTPVRVISRTLASLLRPPITFHG